MWTLLNWITRGFDLALAPFAGMHPLVGLLLVSVVTGVVMLIIFGKTSNQKRISQTKDRLKAHIMELWLFRNDLRVMFRSLLRIGRFNLSYLRYSMVPIVFLLVPVVLIMVQLGIRYANRPLEQGEEARVTVQLREGQRPSQLDLTLEPPAGIQVLTPPLRVDSRGEIDWRIQADRDGRMELAFRTPAGTVTKSVQAGREGRRITLSSLRPTALTWNALLYPVELPIPADSPIQSIRIAYPPLDLSLAGLPMHWLVVFFVVSLLAGLALKGAFGIEV